MRVIAGSAKSRRLVAPKGLGTRPLTDRTKEALFSSLASAVEGAAVLDLFAGSGSMGIEALSRGAASAVFVENDRAALTALRENLRNVGLRGTVQPVSVERYLERLEPDAVPFDLVFVDPPYSLPLASVEGVLDLVSRHLADGAIVVVHRRAGGPAPEAPVPLTEAGSRRYGDSELWRFVKEDR